MAPENEECDVPSWTEFNPTMIISPDKKDEILWWSLYALVKLYSQISGIDIDSDECNLEAAMKVWFWETSHRLWFQSVMCQIIEAIDATRYIDDKISHIFFFAKIVGNEKLAEHVTKHKKPEIMNLKDIPSMEETIFNVIGFLEKYKDDESSFDLISAPYEDPRMGKAAKIFIIQYLSMAKDWLEANKLH